MDSDVECFVDPDILPPIDFEEPAAAASPCPSPSPVALPASATASLKPFGGGSKADFVARASAAAATLAASLWDTAHAQKRTVRCFLQSPTSIASQRSGWSLRFVFKMPPTPPDPPLLSVPALLPVPRAAPAAALPSAPAPAPSAVKRRREDLSSVLPKALPIHRPALGPWRDLGMPTYAALDVAERSAPSPQFCCLEVPGSDVQCPRPLFKFGVCLDHQAVIGEEHPEALSSVWDVTLFTSRTLHDIGVTHSVSGISLLGVHVWGGIAPFARDAAFVAKRSDITPERLAALQRMAFVHGFYVEPGETSLTVKAPDDVAATVFFDEDALLFAPGGTQRMPLQKTTFVMAPSQSLLQRYLRAYDPSMGMQWTLADGAVVRVKAPFTVFRDRIRPGVPVPPHHRSVAGMARPRALSREVFPVDMLLRLGREVNDSGISAGSTFFMKRLEYSSDVDVLALAKDTIALTLPATVDLAYVIGPNQDARWISFLSSSSGEATAYAVLKWFDVAAWDAKRREDLLERAETWTMRGAPGAARAVSLALAPLCTTRVLYVDILASSPLCPGAGKTLLQCLLAAAQALACSQAGPVRLVLEPMSESLIPFYAQDAFGLQPVLVHGARTARFYGRTFFSDVLSPFDTGVASPASTSELSQLSPFTHAWSTLKAVIKAEKVYRATLDKLWGTLDKPDTPAARAGFVHGWHTALFDMLQEYNAFMAALTSHAVSDAYVLAQVAKLCKWVQHSLTESFAPRAAPSVELSNEEVLRFYNSKPRQRQKLAEAVAPL